MATVQLISGQAIENVQLTDTEPIGEEGSKRATAHIGGKTSPVYNSIIDGFDPVWYEQISYDEIYQLTKGAKGFVEGSATSPEETV